MGKISVSKLLFRHRRREDAESSFAPTHAATSGSLPSTGDSAPPPNTDHWSHALEKLQRRKPELSEILNNLKNSSQSGKSIIDQLVLETEKAQQDVAKKQWKVQWKGKEIILREQLEKILKAVQVFQDLGGAAASLDPVHAGLPWAGISFLVQVTTNDLEQYAKMLSGAEEVSIIISRYKELEISFSGWQDTSLDQKLHSQIVVLYETILEYQVQAMCFYQRSSLARFLRSIPNLDDPSSLLEEVRRKDSFCKDLDVLRRHRDLHSLAESHGEKLSEIEKAVKLLSAPADSTLVREPPDHHSVNVHWTISRATNGQFTGRQAVLKKIITILDPEYGENIGVQTQKRFVITGMGGQGKSEICLHVANSLRHKFWGVFWIDVSSNAVAEKDFIGIANKMGYASETIDAAKQLLANVKSRWFLILDNADDPRVDYQNFIPTGPSGCILMTSRIPECQKYETVGYETLEGLEDEDARTLLLRTSRFPQVIWPSLTGAADIVIQTLGSHPLALISAGSYVGKGFCRLQDYPEVFAQKRLQILQFSSKQGQSRYGDVYATFEASAEILENSSESGDRAALELLHLLSVLNNSSLPIKMFETAWKPCLKALKKPDDRSDDALSEWHVHHLPSFISIQTHEWEPYQLLEAADRLSSLSLITKSHTHDSINMSMHPLTHAWAKARQKEIRDAWISAGCVIAFSASSDGAFWKMRSRILSPHLRQYFSVDLDSRLSNDQKLLLARMLINCGIALRCVSEDQLLTEILEKLFLLLNLRPRTPVAQWPTLYGLYAQHLGRLRDDAAKLEVLEGLIQLGPSQPGIEDDDYDQQKLSWMHELAVARSQTGQIDSAIQMYELILSKDKERGSENDPESLYTQRHLAMAYLGKGDFEKSLEILKNILRIYETSDIPQADMLTLQFSFAVAYLHDRQPEKAAELLEHVVDVSSQLYREDDARLLSSQTELSRAYQKMGNLDESLRLKEHVFHVRSRSLPEDSPARLKGEHRLAKFYSDIGRAKEAIPLFEHVLKVRARTLAERDTNLLHLQKMLADAYAADGQRGKAIALLEHVATLEA